MIHHQQQGHDHNGVETTKKEYSRQIHHAKGGTPQTIADAKAQHPGKTDQ
jgi:hypothetical protein